MSWVKHKINDLSESLMLRNIFFSIKYSKKSFGDNKLFKKYKKKQQYINNENIILIRIYMTIFVFCFSFLWFVYFLIDTSNENIIKTAKYQKGEF